MSVTREQVLAALRAVVDPDLHRDIVSLGFIDRLEISGGRVDLVVKLTTPACPVKEQMEEEIRSIVSSLPGVENLELEMTAEVRSRASEPQDLIPNVKQCVAIASGKGGVGKSTVTVNLAIALAQEGASVGILDADVYGPSIPLMMGCDGQQPLVRGEGKARIVPIHAHGISLMSIGFLLQEGQAVLWRGPMVAGTVKQLLSDVDWGELDYLLVDLPPGTGDAPMSLAQLVPLTGVVLVTTPHNVAANIAGKSAALFRRLNAPVLGVVENMATFVCPGCGEEARIFAGMSGEDLATKLAAPYLGSVPLDPEVSRAGDLGIPSLISNPDGAQAKAFRAIGGRVAAQISIVAHANRAAAQAAPTA